MAVTAGDLALVVGLSLLDEAVFAPEAARGRRYRSVPAHRAAGSNLMRDDTPQTSPDRREDIVEVQMRDDGVVHFEQEPQSVAIARQLFLGRPSGFVVQDVVDRDRHLIGDLLHEA